MTSDPANVPDPLEIFEKLQRVDTKKLQKNREVVHKNTGRKRKLPYLPWAVVWREIFSRFADAEFIVHHFPLIENGQVVCEGLLPYLKTDIGYFVKVSLKIGGVTRTLIKNVADHNNVANMDPTCSAITNEIARAFTIAVLRAGHAQLACEVSDATRSPAAGTHRSELNAV